MDDAQDVDAPPVLYLPVRVDEQGELADINMLQLDDGRIALLAYTALDRLIDCCGEQQTWAVFETRKLVELYRSKPFDAKFLDLALSEEIRMQFQEMASC